MGEDILLRHSSLFKKKKGGGAAGGRKEGFAICICKSCHVPPKQKETLTLNRYLFSKLATDMQGRMFK